MKQITTFIVAISLPTFAAAQPADADLAIRARAVLRKHCGECHGLGQTQAGEFSVAARADMDVPARSGRPFLRPGNPAASQIVDLVEAGNMPPGNRPKVPPDERKVLRDWIAADAPGYPKQFDDDYVVDALIGDHAKQPAEARPFQRYVSLAHLVTADTATLSPQRAALQKALRDLSKPDAKLEPVDPAQTVFRIDLRSLGWAEKPFGATEYTKRDEGSGGVPGEAQKPSTLNLFDIILLEYPYGRIDPKAEAVVKAEGAVRPVPFVRGDWLMGMSVPLSKELRLVGSDHLPLRTAPPAKPGPIGPLDARTIGNYAPTPEPFKLALAAVDPKSKEEKTSFRVGERVMLILNANKFVQVEAAVGDPRGRTDVVAIFPAEAHTPAYIKPPSEDGFELREANAPKTTFTVFVSTGPLPPVARHRDRRFAAWLDAEKEGKTPSGKFGDWFADRIVHAAWTDAGPVKDFNPNQIIKRTIDIEVKK